MHYGVKLIDMDHDGRLEISGCMIAPGQIADTLGYNYSDYSAWFMVFNHKLEFVFEPKGFPGLRSFVNIIPVMIVDSNYYVGYYNHMGPLDNYPKLFIANTKGSILQEYEFPKSSKIKRWINIAGINGDLKISVFDEKGTINIFNKDLKLIDRLDLGYDTKTNYKSWDLDMDGIDELIFNINNDEILVTRNDYSNPVSFKTGISVQPLKTIIQNGENKPSLFIYFDGEYQCLQYSKNPLAPLRFLIYLGFFISIWFFIIIIRKLQLIQIQKKENIRHQIIDLQLKSFRNQMDPHFTFNVFNTMAYKIQKESPDSYEAFMEFSNLIRKSLLSSDSITRSIVNELSQLKSYLELEKLRFGDKVNYLIEVDKDVDQNIHIPKMILQTFVENAIKHGIRHKTENGVVTIKIKQDINQLVFEIIDNGVGRKKAKELSIDSTGFGLRIMDNYFKLTNEYNTSKIKHEIIDLYDGQNRPLGTKVKITIPLNFNYNLKKTRRT